MNQYQCRSCGAYFSDVHVCPPVVGTTGPSLYPGQYSFTPTPLTAEEVRKIIREELDRARLAEYEAGK